MTAPRREAGPRVLYFGTYDRAVGRNLIVQEALRAGGASVVECHASVWSDTAAKLAAMREPTPWRVLLRQALAWGRLLSRYRSAGAYDVMLVGATAHLDLPLARALASAADRPLAFDPLVSAFETVRDRALVPAGARRAALGVLERRLLQLPDRVLVDTRAHARALGGEVGLDEERVLIVPAGAPAEVRRRYTTYDARGPRTDRPLRVVYFGQYIPLHGVDVLLRAAHALRGRPDIRFDLVGTGQEVGRCRSLARDLSMTNVTFHEAWLPLGELVERHIGPADLCVGVFGPERKAARIVPFKVFTALASGRPVITADTPAVRELLRPGVEVSTVPPADPAALAAAIATLADRPALRGDLAAFGLRAYDSRFAAPVVGARLVEELRRLAAQSRHGPYVGPRHAWRGERLAAALLDAAPPGSLLDAGCGDGDLAQALASAGRRVTALDMDLGRMRRARGRVHASIGMVCADVRALPFAPASLAGIAAGEVLEHVPDDEAASRELARALAPGGILALTVPAGPSRYGAIDVAAGHRRRYDCDGLARVLRGAGLRVVTVRAMGFPFGRLYDRWVQRPALGARATRGRGVVSRLGRLGAVHRLWRALFGLDDRLPASGSASGLLAVARRTVPEKCSPGEEIAGGDRGPCVPDRRTGVGHE